ncbi:transposase [Pseudogracilibacillus sp. SO30301A]|uniref:transposase n=1 Tax=Pseudogracilibacillus sp. SO30301A TaxID=3098291 RepID=UPI00300E2FB1
MNIIQHILDNPDDTNFDVSSMLHGSMKHKTKTIVKSIQGNLTEPQTDKMSVSLDHMESIEKHISDIESVVLKLVQPYLPQVELILSLPGIKDIFKAIAILGEIGVDMSVFHSQKHICSWTGLTPQNNESVGKKNPSVFHELVFISSLYWYNAQMLRLKVRIVLTSKCAMSKLKNVGVTKNRLLRLLIICIYQMLDKNEPFNDELYKIDIHPKPKRPYAPQITEDMAIRYLETFGYQIPDKRVIT